MALPVTISGTKMPDQNYFCGPFKSSGGNFYVVLLDSTGSTPEIHKATDPTSSFTEQDAANAPGNSCLSMWAYQVGDVLHIVQQTVTVFYHTFSMGTDTWGTKNELIETPKDAPTSGYEGCSIALRSDGDVIVLYTGDQDAVMGTTYNRCDYARKEGTWTVGVNVGGGGLEQHHTAGMVLMGVVGGSDRAHFFWTDVTNSTAYARRLTSANALGTANAADSTASANAHGFCPGVSYDSPQANWDVHSGYIDSDSTLDRTRSNDADNPIIFISAIATETVKIVSQTAVACLALDSGASTLYALYSDASTSDLWQRSSTEGVSYGSATEVLDAVTINRVSCNVYDRSGTKLAYVYDDGGTVKYNEVSLGAAFGGEESPWTVYTAPKPEEVVMVYG